MKKFLALFIVPLYLLTSCQNQNDDGGHGSDHGDAAAHEDQELPGVAYTLYSDRTELFVEFKPLVVGVESRFAAHFTHLGTLFKPYTEGTITLTLEAGGKAQTITSNEPMVPGIFRLRMTPQKAGKGRLVFYMETAASKDTIVLDDITVYPDEATARKNTPPEEESTDISYLKEQAWKVEFANEAVTPQAFNEVIKTSGQILSSPGDETIVTAPASGVVSFAGNATAGSNVQSGQRLFTLSGGNIAQGNVETSYKESQANFNKAKADYDRASELIQDKIISQKEFSDAQLRYQNAQTGYNAFAKNYSGNGLSVASNMSGFIRQVFVTDGQFVQAGEPLAAVSKNKNLILRAELSQRYYSKLSGISSANFRTDNTDVVYNTKDLGGKLVSYGRSAASNTSIPVTFEIENPGTLVPGSFVEVYLHSSPIENALVVPVTALVEEQGNFYVYVQTEGESFQKREVKHGGNDGKNVQLLSGVSAGERVVTKGAYQIKLATLSGAMPAHGHEH